MIRRENACSFSSITNLIVLRHHLWESPVDSAYISNLEDTDYSFVLHTFLFCWVGISNLVESYQFPLKYADV